MNHFTKNLRDQVGKVFGKDLSHESNPLVIIGLTEAILDLGLTEEQLHFAVRSYCRQLAAQVHPDRSPDNISAKRQEQILGAFNVIDDIKKFSIALKEFKNLKAEDRSELRVLRDSLSSYKARLAGMESEFSAITERRNQLEKEIADFKKLKEAEPSQVPILESEVDYLSKRIDDLQERLKVSQESSQRWKRKTENSIGFISRLGQINPDISSEISAFDAKWVAVAVLGAPDRKHPSPLDESGEINNQLKNIARMAMVKEDALRKVIGAWNRAESEYGTPDRLEVKSLPLCFAFMRLRGGKLVETFGDRRASYSGRVIGSIPMNTHFTKKRSYLIHNISQDAIFETFTPYISVDRVLVSIFREKGRRMASWSDTCPAFSFSTKRIVLGVG